MSLLTDTLSSCFSKPVIDGELYGYIHRMVGKLCHHQMTIRVEPALFLYYTKEIVCMIRENVFNSNTILLIYTTSVVKGVLG